MAIVYVMNQNKKALMPTTRCGHVRLLLKQGKAEVVSVKPFTIRLKYNCPGETQRLILGIDPGRTNIGVSVIKESGEPVFSAHLETRNKEIPKLMTKRKTNRMKHRGYGRRDVRQRRALKADTAVQSGEILRVLPGCKEPIRCKVIRNKEARFNNRLRSEGWLTPTAHQLLHTHVNLIRKLMKFLPITNIVLELNRFAFMQLDHPELKKWMIDFQHGPLYGYDGLYDAVSDMQGDRCLLCGNHDIEHYHHIVPRSKRGSNTIANIAGLCEECHHKVHTDENTAAKLKSIKAGLNKKYGALSVLNQIIPYLVEELHEMFCDHLFVTTGYFTKRFREKHRILKGHDMDAYCIACSVLKELAQPISTLQTYELRQFRRHDRMACKREMVDRKYVLGGKVVAVNRRRAFEQKNTSLEEYAEHNRIDNLQVKPHKPVYQRTERIMPGAVFVVNGERKVMTASKGLYKNRPNYFIFSDETRVGFNSCKLVNENEGIVFV